MVTAIVLDNGETTLKACLNSLLNQSVKLKEIVVAPGPKSDFRLLREYSSKYPMVRVLDACKGTGRCRARAIKECEDEYILSCDSDTIYAKDYAYWALTDLTQGYDFVRAGSIGCLQMKGYNPVWTTIMLMPFFAVEFCMAFRKSEFLRKGFAEEKRYTKHYEDFNLGLIGHYRYLTDYRMFCWTKFPLGSQHWNRS